MSNIVTATSVLDIMHIIVQDINKLLLIGHVDSRHQLCEDYVMTFSGGSQQGRIDKKLQNEAFIGQEQSSQLDGNGWFR